MERVDDKLIFSERELDDLVRSIKLKADQRIAAGGNYDEVYRDLALELMHLVHNGTKTKIGELYIDHTTFVGDSQLPDLINATIGYLHDVGEHSNIKGDHLRKMGFSEEVIENYEVLTKPDDELFYLDYGQRVGLYARARKVKKADMWHNNRDDRQPDEKLHQARVLRRECYRLLGHYYDYLDYLEQTGQQDRIEYGEATIGVFLYETNFLDLQTQAQRELIRTALLTKSDEPMRMEWYKNALNRKPPPNRLYSQPIDINELPSFHGPF